jgi:hypothetical protein
MTPMMILRLSKEKSQKLNPKRTLTRSTLIDHKLLLQLKKKLRFSPLQVLPKLKVNSLTLKLVEIKRITKLNVVEEEVVTEVAAVEVANGEIKQEKLVMAVEVAVSILDLALLTRLMPRVPLVLKNKASEINVRESQMKVKTAVNMRDLTEEMAPERLVVVEKISRMVIASPEVIKLRKNQKRRSKKKLLLKRKRRSLNLNMKKLSLE